MTVSATLAPASMSELLLLVEEARHKRYDSGIIGVYARPSGIDPADVESAGQRVRIRPAESALAVREALREHVDGDWMLIVTDCPESDLGAGIIAHFVWRKLRRPDAWESLRQAFSATGIAASLTSTRRGSDLARAILAARPAEGWPPAPAGVLTRAHVMSSVAQAHLGLVDDVMDAIAVLGWASLPKAQAALATLRDAHGDLLADALVEWVAESAGSAREPIAALLAAGRAEDLVPVGLALHLITAEGQSIEELQVSRLAAVRLEPTLGKPLPSREALVAHGTAAVAVLAELTRTERNDAHVGRILARADAILASLDASSLASRSDELASGWRQRLARLAATLQRGAAQLRVDEATPEVDREIESAWAACAIHRLARRGSPESVAFDAAVKLWRWLRSPDVPDSADLVARVRAHLDDGAWADVAINDVDTGVDDSELSAALHAVFDAATARREREERAFAGRLAIATAASASATGSTDEAIWPIEALLPSLVIPMAKRTPVLLVVMDGMSAAASTEIVADVTEQSGWVEAAALPGISRRGAALSVLPSVTEASRASLLCGALRTGGQDVERQGYAALTDKSAKIRGELFHKKGVDTTRPGALVADGVGAAIDDTEGVELVTVVLNTIDDALDRSDPVGTVWNADAVKHLAPVLGRARAAGRTVVMTSDHGHVVERRRGTQRSAPDMTSGRSRGLSSPAQADEIAVEGERVLTADHRAVLAVSEGLRYGPLKAGYHGGASAQEVVVPVIVLLPDEQTNPLGLPLLPPQSPAWWSVADGIRPPVALETESWSAPARPGRPVVQETTLFDEADGRDRPAAPTSTLGAQVVASPVYAAQRQMLSRLPIRDEQVSDLIAALESASGQRLPRAVVATRLGVPAFRVDGALSQVRQMLNVEGYNVIALDPDGQSVILDLALLRDQFEVR